MIAATLRFIALTIWLFAAFILYKATFKLLEYNRRIRYDQDETIKTQSSDCSHSEIN